MTRLRKRYVMFKVNNSKSPINLMASIVNRFYLNIDFDLCYDSWGDVKKLVECYQT